MYIFFYLYLYKSIYTHIYIYIISHACARTYTQIIHMPSEHNTVIKHIRACVNVPAPLGVSTML